MVFERDEQDRVFHLTARGVSRWIIAILTIISLSGSIGYSLLDVGTRLVRGYDTMSHAIEQNTDAVAQLGHQMAANLRTNGHRIDKVAGELSQQIAALSRRTDNVQDLTHVLEINQARVLDALKMQGIVNERGDR